jgi:hypothetical protein
MNFFRNITKWYRGKDWYRSKASGLVGLLILFALQFQLSFLSFVQTLIPAFFTLVGIAAFGYFLNDFGDQKDDIKSGATNTVVGLKWYSKLGLLITSLGLALLPWYYLPFTDVTLWLLLAEFGLFIVYSLKPFKLKRVALLGVLIDSLYAHALPTFLAAYTFCIISEMPFDETFFGVLIIWQFVVGIRSIVQHHIKDRKKDALAGTYNVFNHLKGRVLYVVGKRLIPAEVVLFVALCFIMDTGGYWLLFFFMIFMANQAFMWRNAIIWRIRGRYKKGNASPAFFYEHRIGVIAGLILMFVDVKYGLVLAAYILVFWIDLRAIYLFLTINFFKYLFWPFIINYYKTVVRFYHHVVLKNGYYYGHKLKVLLGIKEPNNK